MASKLAPIWQRQAKGNIMPLGTEKATLMGVAGAGGGTRAVFWTGTRAAPDTMTNIIDYVTIETLGDATDFGDISERRSGSATSNGETDRGVYGGGQTGSPPSTPVHNEIFYITISTPGNASDFGDLTSSRTQVSATSNTSNDRGVWFGGYTGSGTSNVIDYITVSSTGNATDFGDTSTVGAQDTSACSSGTNERGIFSGGNRTSLSNVIDYITISTPSNATDFGDLLAAASFTASCDNQTNDRGVMSGGYAGSHQDVIQYVTITSLGNSADFGDLSQPWYGAEGTGNGTGERGLFAGGYPDTGGVNSPVIQYITINSAGDAADFGDMTVERSNLGACSNVG